MSGINCFFFFACVANFGGWFFGNLRFTGGESRVGDVVVVVVVTCFYICSVRPRAFVCRCG